MSLTVKAYLEKAGVTKPEIRRFAIDQDVSTNFNYLSQKLNTIFPGLGSKNYQVFWKDEEEDLVSLSSDEELLEALGRLQEDVFKVYVKEVGSSGGEDGLLHPNVVCDGCEGPVYGSRYKCISCPDYDLCSTCHGRGLHQEHNMMCLRQPGSPFMAFMGPHGPFGHPPPPGGPFGHPPPPGGPFGPHGGPPPPGGPHGPWNHGTWRQMRRQWRQWWQQMTGQPAGKKDSQPPSAGACNKPCEEQDKPTENCANPGDEYLRTIGEQVAALLDPMGIDVAVDIEHNGQRKRCGQKENQGCKGSCKAKMQKEPDQKPAKGDSPMTDVKSEKVSSHNEDMETGEPDSGIDTTRKTKETSPAPSAQSDGSDGEWVTIQRDDQLKDDPKKDEIKPEEKKFEFAPEPMAPPEEPPAYTPLYPDVPSSHPDPHIQEALEQMMSMGFNNEDGWLTRLLESKSGNISQVLDSMKPQ